MNAWNAADAGGLAGWATALATYLRRGKERHTTGGHCHPACRDTHLRVGELLADDARRERQARALRAIELDLGDTHELGRLLALFPSDKPARR